MKNQIASRQPGIAALILRTSLCIAFGATLGYAVFSQFAFKKCTSCDAKEHRVTGEVSNFFIDSFTRNRDFLAPSLAIDTLFISRESMSSLLSSSCEGFRYYFAVKDSRLRLAFFPATCNTSNAKYDDVLSSFIIFPDTAIVTGAQLIESARGIGYCSDYGRSASYSNDKVKAGFFCKKFFNDYLSADASVLGFKIFFAGTKTNPTSKTLVFKTYKAGDTLNSLHLRQGLDMSNPCPVFCGTSTIW